MRCYAQDERKKKEKTQELLFHIDFGEFKISILWIPGFQDSRFKDSGIPRIPDSKNPRFKDSTIPDSRFQGSQGFHIPGFEIRRFPNSKGSILGIPNRVSIASSRYHLR
ncbi:MAG: hypothetical protein IPN69_04625 [Acidobacteria bacterium]|nr:hypothetical protein [Acidobacteriota bacterium]